MPDKEKDSFKSIAKENHWEGTNMSLGQRFLSGSQGFGSFYPQTGFQEYIPNTAYPNVYPQPIQPIRTQNYNMLPNQYPTFTDGSLYNQFEQSSSQPTAQSITAQSLSHISSSLVNIPSQVPPAIPMNLMFSASGFDVVSALVKMATRENPKIELGPIDMTCSFLVSDLRVPDAPIVYVSPSFELLTGYSTNEILDPSGQVYPGSTRSYTDHSVVQKMKICVDERQEGQFTLVNYKKNGEPFLNHLTMIPISFSETKEITHYIGLQIDLIQQPQAILKRLNTGTYSVAEEQAKKSDRVPVSIPEPQEMGNCTVPKLLLSFVDSCPDFIFVLSLRGLFLHVSTDSCRKTLEYEPDDMIGHKIAEFVHPSDLVSVMRDLRNCSTEGSINFICRIRRKKSGYFYMEMNGRVYSGSKRNRCFIISGRELLIPQILQSSFYYPELIPENETWVKISPQGLILYATSTCDHFFAIPPDSICVHSIYDFLEGSERSSFAEALMTDSNQVLQCTIIGAGKSNMCLVRILRVQDHLRNICWLQIKKKPMEMMFMDSDTNLYGVVEGVKSSSVFYECNKLKVKNSKLIEEIESLA